MDLPGREKSPKIRQLRNTRYPPIASYGYIADCHSQALISSSGSIDWCCMPRADSPSCFGRLLDWEKGGYCQISPKAAFEYSRQYLKSTLILETMFTTEDGEARLLDCFTLNAGYRYQPYQQILRIVEGISGRLEFGLEFVPRFDYGSTKPWVKQIDPCQFHVFGGSDSLLVSGEFNLEARGRHALTGSGVVEKGQRLHFSIVYQKPEILHDGQVPAPEAPELDRRLEETRHWWVNWCSTGNINVHYREQVLRAAIVLKGLSNLLTGSLAAAPTTSLPETPGGERNWDYRYTWVRDSSFAVRSLAELNFSEEANDFRKFIERSAAGSVEDLQVIYGMGGERRIREYHLKELEGYRGANPVRVGNAAGNQHQMDLYGWLLNLAWKWHARGHTPDKDYWEFLVELANRAATDWPNPGHGLWEMRGKPRHFVLSKAMCWQALDCAVKLADDLGHKAHLSLWQKSKDEIRQAVEERGYDPERRVFIQAFDYRIMDSALLLLPITGFVDFKDERMIRTADAIREDLEEDGLLRRYPVGTDNLEGKEGVFLPSSFWLADCLAHQGRMQEAHQVFQRALATGNDLWLFSEEFDTENQTMLGNFPQALTHLSLIAAAVALTETEKDQPQ